MTVEVFANDFTTTLASGISSSVTTATIADALPTALQSGQFRILVQSADLSVEERMIAVKGASNTTLTITRAAEGSTAASFLTGATVLQVLTTGALAKTISDANASLAPLASPAFTGNPTAPTQPAADGSTKLASTAYSDRAATNAAGAVVVPAPSGTTPAIDGTAAVGTSTAFARADHIHPTDTTRAPLAPRSLAITTNTAAPAINITLYDEVDISGQSVAITSFTSGLTGTAVNGQVLIIRIAATSSNAIAWGASFVSSGSFSLPTALVSGKTITVGLKYNLTAAKWVCLAVDSTGY